MLLAPLARLRVQVVGVEVLGSLRRHDDLSDLLHLLDVLGVSGDLGQVGELHVQGSELGQDAGAAAGPAEIFRRLEI